MKNKVEFSDKGIETNPRKVSAIANYPCPKTLRNLITFLDLSGYYAKLAKPLTSLLKVEGGHVSKSVSSKKVIFLRYEALNSFKKLKGILVSKEIFLRYPDFNKFHLTADASKFANGAVLWRDNHPISFLSRTFYKAEESYAAKICA